MSLTQREAFARLMEHMCAHDGDRGHGYSQYDRWGDGTTEDVDLGDGVTVTVAGGDRDCSSGIISCLRAVGVDTHGATYTGNMREELLKTGLFEWQRMGVASARRGDIYLNETHHTAMCTCADPDMLAQFSRSETHGIDGETGDQDGYESNIRSYYSYPWDGKLVWLDDGETSRTNEDESADADADAVPDEGEGAVYRLYNRHSDLHLFTSSRDEAQGLADKGWAYEGLGWRSGSGNPVYRLYNQWTGGHLLTSSVTEVGACVIAGWKYEGELGRGNRAVHRLYNGTDHMYTADESEYKSLLSCGWCDEGTL